MNDHAAGQGSAEPATGRRLVLVIHHMNSWGGQERCTLEVARRLSHRWPVDIYAFTLEGSDLSEGWGDVRFHKIRPHVEHPELLRSICFYAATVPSLWVARCGEQKALIHAAGACSLVSDIVQVHYVHSAWKARRANLPEHLRLPARAISKGGLGTSLRMAYDQVLLEFNVFTERITFGRGKTYIAISECVARELREYLGIEDRVHVIHHGVDPHQFHPVDEETRGDRDRIRRECGIQPDEVVAVFVGAYDRKGLATAVEALALIPRANIPRLKLMAIGGGDKERYVSLARRCGVEERIILAGHRKDVARYYRAGDLFLFPTLYEPFGMVILEAMASGLPPVVSRLAGAAELIEGGVSGMLLEDPSDPKEIAAALGPLIADEKARVEMGSRARAAVADRTWDRVAWEYGRVLEPLMEATSQDGRGRVQGPSGAG